MLQLFSAGSDEHISHEESMVGTGADHADVNSVLLIPAGISVYHVDSVAGVKVVDGSFAVDLPDLQKAQSVLRFVFVVLERQKWLLPCLTAAQCRQLHRKGKAWRERGTCASLCNDWWGFM